MSASDFISLGIGMSTHEKKLKKLGTTPRENILLAYQHQIPYTIPSYFIEGSLIVPIADMEHSSGTGKALDGFGWLWRRMDLDAGAYVLHAYTWEIHLRGYCRLERKSDIPRCMEYGLENTG